MFRVYHRTDPVPKFLPWPYAHVPNVGIDYYLPSPETNFSATYHEMGKYIEAIKREGNWSQLKSFTEETKTEFGIARWLESKNTNTLLLIADPSRPYMVDDRERSARFWEVTGF